jgi:lipopolysaccharide/colanic/teichoic acid biosynthesis glycosyltransferase
MSMTAPLPPTEENLVVRYERMAHTYERGSVDTILRTLDVVLSGVALVVLSPIIGLTALAVLIAGGRPVLYRGQRVGRGGSVFTMHKFRTLRPDAEQRLGPYLGAELTALTANEVSRLGRVLRATKLDELPQLWNVLRGDMSVVGPRPIRPTFFAELCQEIPQYWQRLVVPPGLTGLAQLRLTREMSWAEKLAHDMEYIADRSLGLYIRAILATMVKIASDALRSISRTLSGT